MRSAASSEDEVTNAVHTRVIDYILDGVINLQCVETIMDVPKHLAYRMAIEELACFNKNLAVLLVSRLENAYDEEKPAKKGKAKPETKKEKKPKMGYFIIAYPKALQPAEEAGEVEFPTENPDPMWYSDGENDEDNQDDWTTLQSLAIAFGKKGLAENILEQLPDDEENIQSRGYCQPVIIGPMQIPTRCHIVG